MIIKAIVRAFRGRLRWIKIKREYGVEENGVYAVLMPDSDRGLNESALRNIDRFLDYRKGNAVIILTSDDWTAGNARQFSERITTVDFITERDCFYLICYFYFNDCSFSERFIVISLQDSNGKRLALAENVCKIKKDDMVCLGLFLIRDWVNSEALDG